MWCCSSGITDNVCRWLWVHPVVQTHSCTLQGQSRLHQVQDYCYVTPIHILNINQDETLLQHPTDHNKWSTSKKIKGVNIHCLVKTVSASMWLLKLNIKKRRYPKLTISTTSNHWTTKNIDSDSDLDQEFGHENSSSQIYYQATGLFLVSLLGSKILSHTPSPQFTNCGIHKHREFLEMLLWSLFWNFRTCA